MFCVGLGNIDGFSTKLDPIQRWNYYCLCLKPIEPTKIKEELNYDKYCGYIKMWIWVCTLG